MSDTNGADNPGGENAEGANETELENAEFRMLAQYVKDLSFENPEAVSILGSGAEQPQMDVSVNVGVAPHEQDRYEVTLKFTINATSAERTVFIVELEYAALFLIQGIPQESLQPVLLIECPRLIFPFARRIIADVTSDGGYPPLMLDPIDFVGLYRSQQERRAAQQQGEPPAPGAAAT